MKVTSLTIAILGTLAWKPVKGVDECSSACTSLTRAEYLEDIPCRENGIFSNCAKHMIREAVPKNRLTVQDLYLLTPQDALDFCESPDRQWKTPLYAYDCVLGILEAYVGLHDFTVDNKVATFEEWKSRFEDWESFCQAGTDWKTCPFPCFFKYRERKCYFGMTYEFRPEYIWEDLWPIPDLS